MDIAKEGIRWLVWDKFQRDNWGFNLYSKLAVCVFMVSGVVCITKTNFDFISCIGFDDENDFCINEVLVKGCNAVDDSRQSQCPQEEGDTVYYAWVEYILIINGLLFLIPNVIWKYSEGKLMEEFNYLILPSENEHESYYARKFVDLHRNVKRRYFGIFVFCEFLNIVVAVGNFLIINSLLNGKFQLYGIGYFEEDVSYDEVGEDNEYEYGDEESGVGKLFPTTLSCDCCFYGQGAYDKRNAACSMPYNQTNEYTFLIMWFLLLVLFAAGLIIILYRFLTITISPLRVYELKLRLKFATGGDRNISDHGVCDWFILCQIAKNAKTPQHFNTFMQHVTQIREKGETINLATTD